MNRQRLFKTLENQEGRRYEPYPDSRGIPTVGIGLNLRDVGYKGKKYASVEAFKADYPDGLTDAEIEAAFIEELERIIGNVIEFCEDKGVDYNELSDLRQEIIVNMIFNMGFGGIDKFSLMWQHLAAGNYIGAALEMLHSSRGKLSSYVRQVQMRAVRLAIAMATDDEAALEL